MLELAQPFLDLESIARGGGAVNIQAVAVLPLLHQAPEAPRGKAQTNGLALWIEPPLEPLPHLPADPVILRESMENPVSNAIMFVAPGLPRRCVVLAGGPGWFSVKDEGFTVEGKAKASRSSHRRQPVQQAGQSSSGLGLAIERALVIGLSRRGRRHASCRPRKGRPGRRG